MHTLQIARHARRSTSLLFVLTLLSANSTRAQAASPLEHAIARINLSSSPLKDVIAREAERMAAEPTPAVDRPRHNAHARRQRLGPWAGVAGLFVGAFVGAAVDCALTDCGPGSSNIPTGVPIGMIVGALTPVLAPREVGASFLGIGGGAMIGAAAGAAIQGDCSGAHPCDRGAAIGSAVGAAAGGLGAHRLVSRD